MKNIHFHFAGLFAIIASLLAVYSSLTIRHHLQNYLVTTNSDIPKKSAPQSKHHPSHHDDIQAPSRRLVFGGGFGTTATHAMFKATCQLKLRSVHYRKQCGFRKRERFNSTAPEIPSAGILAHERLLRAHRALKDCVAAATANSSEEGRNERENENEDVVCPTVQEALDGMRHHIQNVLQNRQDIDALHDTPYPEFAEYVMEAEERIRGMRPILLLSERDPQVWAKKRSAGHTDDLICKLKSSNYSKDEIPAEVYLGQNMYWCLQTAIKKNMSNASIRDIFWNVHQLDSRPEERGRMLQEGYRLYRDFMRDMGAVYRVDLFNRNENIHWKHLASKINAAVKESTQSDLIGGSEPTNRLIVRRTPDFHTRKGCMPNHQVAFSSGRFCDKLVLFLHFHKAGGSSIIEYFIDRGLWYDLGINEDVEKYGILQEGEDLTFGGYGKNHLRIHSYSEPLSSSKNNHTRVASKEFWTSIYNRGLDVVNLEYNFLSPDVFLGMESSFWKIVQFRDPWDRFRSTYEREIGIKCRNVARKGKCFQSYSLKRWMTKHDGVMTGSREKEWVGILYPNYYVRMLNGMGDYPRDTILTRDHLETAKAVLQKFDVVMILEDPDRVNVEKLIGLFGMMDEKMPTIQKESNNRLKVHRLYPFLRKDVINPMQNLFREQNQLDIELYEYVKTHFS